MAKKSRKSAAPKRASTKKAGGAALHIGLNAVDPAHYAGWSGPLNACEQDARDMAAVAKKTGIKVEHAADQKGHARQNACRHPCGRQEADARRFLPADLFRPWRPG